MSHLLFHLPHKTRFVLPLLLGFILTACSPSTDSLEKQIEPATEAKIANLFTQWNAALQTGDPKKVTAFYADDAVLLPTVSNQVRDNHDEIEAYFEHFLELKPSGKINEQHIFIKDDIAINTGVYTFNLAVNDETHQVEARYNFVYERQKDGEWLIVNHHSSVMPKTDAEKPVSLQEIIENVDEEH